MNNIPEFSNDILSQGISGFHVYALASTAFLSFASDNLAGMLGYPADEILKTYPDLIHKDDRKAFDEFVKSVLSVPQTKTLEYRLKKKDGSYIFVSDTTTSKILENGEVSGFSVLTDITSIKKENENLQFLSETVPCGF